MPKGAPKRKKNKKDEQKRAKITKVEKIVISLLRFLCDLLFNFSVDSRFATSTSTHSRLPKLAGPLAVSD